MSPHPLRTLIETCDAAISRRDFDALMTFYAEDAALVVEPGMVVRGIPAIRRAFTAAYSHAWRSLNNIHADHVITSMPITQ